VSNHLPIDICTSFNGLFESGSAMQVEFSIVLGDIIVYFIAVFYAVIILTIADTSLGSYPSSADLCYHAGSC
jgi:hypothetical protein